MSEPSLEELFEGSNVKLANQIIHKHTLADLIESTEIFYNYMFENYTKFEPWQREIVGRNLKHLKLLNQKLGYE